MFCREQETESTRCGCGLLLKMNTVPMFGWEFQIPEVIHIITSTTPNTNTSTTLLVSLRKQNKVVVFLAEVSYKTIVCNQSAVKGYGRSVPDAESQIRSWSRSETIKRRFTASYCYVLQASSNSTPRLVITNSKH